MRRGCPSGFISWNLAPTHVSAPPLGNRNSGLYRYATEENRANCATVGGPLQSHSLGHGEENLSKAPPTWRAGFALPVCVSLRFVCQWPKSQQAFRPKSSETPKCVLGHASIRISFARRYCFALRIDVSRYFAVDNSPIFARRWTHFERKLFADRNRPNKRGGTTREITKGFFSHSGRLAGQLF